MAVLRGVTNETPRLIRAAGHAQRAMPAASAAAGGHAAGGLAQAHKHVCLRRVERTAGQQGPPRGCALGVAHLLSRCA